jgi:multisubunit Na+/H+ antiporter MnhB subunit
MKLNKYQKALLTIYGLAFAYFTIIRLPFKSRYNSKIEYDTLFSNKSNLDTGRLFLTFAVITVISAIIFLLLRNLNLKFHIFPKKTLRTTIYVVLGALVLTLTVLSIRSFKPKENRNPDGDHKSKSDNIIAPDSTAVIQNNSSQTDKDPFLLRDSKKAEKCTQDNALLQFRSYMKFYYPDWKIYGNPTTRESADCTFQVEFTTMNPRIKYEKEVIVVEIEFVEDYTKYYFRTVRGLLY